MKLFQSQKSGKNSVNVQASGKSSIAAGGNISGNAVTGNGNRVAMSGSYNNSFGDVTIVGGKGSSFTSMGRVSVEASNNEVSITTKDGKDIKVYLNGKLLIS